MLDYTEYSRVMLVERLYADIILTSHQNHNTMALQLTNGARKGLESRMIVYNKQTFWVYATHPEGSSLHSLLTDLSHSNVCPPIYSQNSVKTIKKLSKTAFALLSHPYLLSVCIWWPVSCSGYFWMHYSKCAHLAVILPRKSLWSL